MTQEDVLQFWFTECSPKDWFQKNQEFDAMVRERFLALYVRVSKGETYEWRQTAQGRLAEILVLDQLSRNMFRNTPQAFASDMQCLTLAQEMVQSGHDQRLSISERKFAYMPYMHSESLAIQEVGVDLFTKLGAEVNLRFMIAHRDVIVKFGRFPHRNPILGRVSSAEELAYVAEHGGF